jgi:hypothetical protein
VVPKIFAKPTTNEEMLILRCERWPGSRRLGRARKMRRLLVGIKGRDQRSQPRAGALTDRMDPRAVVRCHL